MIWIHTCMWILGLYIFVYHVSVRLHDNDRVFSMMFLIKSVRDGICVHISEKHNYQNTRFVQILVCPSAACDMILSMMLLTKVVGGISVPTHSNQTHIST